MENDRQTTAAGALRALQDVTDSRAAVARRVTAPWWYRGGAALCTALLFVGVGLVVGPAGRAADGSGDVWGNTLVVLGAVVGPVALLAALRRSSGVSVDRYARGLGPWYAVVFGSFVVAFVLEAFAGVPHALVVAGVLAFAATLVSEHRIDARWRERVRLGSVAS